MKVVEEIRRLLSSGDEVEKERGIEDIGDRFQYGGMDSPELIEGIDILLAHIPMEKDDAVKESILHSIHNGIVYQDIASDISLDLLVPVLSTFNEEQLTYVLTFMGFSGKGKYKSSLETFLHHSSGEIIEAAKEAIIEIEYRGSSGEGDRAIEGKVT
ncbi:hypothetical protein ASG66_02565 [Bacillus sp. Leaf406]|nr:hypothetical protein ASG66_02565 [Bacillus sp. Leaf406]